MSPCNTEESHSAIFIVFMAAAHELEQQILGFLN